jgi:hypothetical protein
MNEPNRNSTASQTGGQGDKHWLTRPATIKWLWVIFALILATTVGLQFLIPVEGKFGLDGSFGFGAWFGFLSCVAMVLVARVLGWLLKRPEDYYEPIIPDPGLGETVDELVEDSEQEAQGHG